jgi:hypothetical protein
VSAPGGKDVATHRLTVGSTRVLASMLPPASTLLSVGAQLLTPPRNRGRLTQPRCKTRPMRSRG